MCVSNFSAAVKHLSFEDSMTRGLPGGKWPYHHMLLRALQRENALPTPPFIDYNIFTIIVIITSKSKMLEDITLYKSVRLHRVKSLKFNHPTLKKKMKSSSWRFRFARSRYGLCFVATPRPLNNMVHCCST